MSESPNSVAPSSGENALEDLRFFGDVPISIAIHLGTRTMKIRDILQLQTNSLIELPKSAGENVDILLNGYLLAFGEVIKLEGSTGIRLTDFNIGI